MKSLLLLVVLGMSSTVTVAKAESVSWLEGGYTVNATEDETSVAKANGDNNAPLQVTLAAGQTVSLLGNVYVKADDTLVVLKWALDQGYIAYTDQYIENIVHIEVAAADSIAVANQVAQLKGVTTAAPRYQAPRVKK